MKRPQGSWQIPTSLACHLAVLSSACPRPNVVSRTATETPSPPLSSVLWPGRDAPDAPPAAPGPPSGSGPRKCLRAPRSLPVSPSPPGLPRPVSHRCPSPARTLGFQTLPGSHRTQSPHFRGLWWLLETKSPFFPATYLTDLLAGNYLGHGCLCDHTRAPQKPKPRLPLHATVGTRWAFN